MAYPNETNPNRRPTSINRDNEGWGIVPMFLGLLALIAIGAMMFGNRNVFDTRTTRTSEPPGRSSIPSTPTTPPITTTPAPTTPSNR